MWLDAKIESTKRFSSKKRRGMNVAFQDKLKEIGVYCEIYRKGSVLWISFIEKQEDRKKILELCGDFFLKLVFLKKKANYVRNN